MIKIGSLILLSFLFFQSSAWSQAAAIKSYLNLDSNEVVIGDPFEMVVSIVSKEDLEVANPRAPQLDGFDLLGQNQSTQTSHRMVSTPSGMDWQTQTETQFIYTFKATKLGQLSIGSFDVVVAGKSYRTQPILVKVVASGAGRQQGRPSLRGNPFGGGGIGPDEDPFEALDKQEEEMFRQLLDRRQNTMRQADPQIRTLPGNPNEAFFVQVEVDKTEVYEGEQILVSWYIYTRGQIQSLDRTKFPDLRGFWKEIVEEVPAIQFQEEIINGIPYRKALLATHALFPLKAGTATIDEFKLKAKVAVPQRGSLFGMGTPYEFTKSSKPVKIKVNPLPVQGRPGDFSGAVGQFQVTTRSEQTQVGTNQPFSVKIRFEGQGNAKGIELPAIQWPDGFELYDTKSDSKFFKNGQSYKEFEVLLIPRQVGDFNIPGFTVSSFDPAQKKYVTLSTQAIPIKVVQGSAAPSTSQRVETAAGVDSNPKTAKGPELPSVIKVQDFGSSSSSFAKPGVLAGILYLFISLGLLGYARQEMGWGVKKRDLKKLTLKRLKKVEVDVKAKDFRKVGVGMTNLFSFLLGELAGAGGGAQEIRRLIESAPPSLRNQYGEALLKRFETFQTFAFAPEEILSSISKETLSKEFDEASDLIFKVLSSYAPEEGMEQKS